MINIEIWCKNKAVTLLRANRQIANNISFVVTFLNRYNWIRLTFLYIENKILGNKVITKLEIITIQKKSIFIKLLVSSVKKIPLIKPNSSPKRYTAKNK
jgi:hypothetical protein